MYVVGLLICPPRSRGRPGSPAPDECDGFFFSHEYETYTSLLFGSTVAANPVQCLLASQSRHSMAQQMDFAFQGIFIHPDHMSAPTVTDDKSDSFDVTRGPAVWEEDLLALAPGPGAVLVAAETSLESERVQFSTLSLASSMASASSFSSGPSSVTSSTLSSPYWGAASLSSSITSLDYFSHSPAPAELAAAAFISGDCSPHHIDGTSAPLDRVDFNAAQAALYAPRNSAVPAAALFDPTFSFGAAGASTSLSSTSGPLDSPGAPISIPGARQSLPASGPVSSTSAALSRQSSSSSMMKRSYSTPVETQKALDERQVLLGVVGNCMNARARGIFSAANSASTSRASTRVSSPIDSPRLSGASSPALGGASRRSTVADTLPTFGRSLLRSVSSPSTPLRRPSSDSLHFWAEEDWHTSTADASEEEGPGVFPYNLIVRPTVGLRTESGRPLLRSYSVTQMDRPGTLVQEQHSFVAQGREGGIKRRNTVLMPLTRIA